MTDKGVIWGDRQMSYMGLQTKELYGGTDNGVIWGNIQRSYME